MISYIEGTILEKEERTLTLLVHGIGYMIYTTGSILNKLREGTECSFWTHMVVREDAHTLYGFKDKEELRFFELLIGISGIGPKTALGILNVSSVDSIRIAVSTGDTSHLTKVSGIGKKVADKIVLELKGKFGTEMTSGVSLRDEVDAVEALKSIGFNQKDAREALKEVDPSITNTGERIKKALKILGK